MALHITNQETERNVRALAAAMGEPISEAVNKAAIDRLKLVKPPENTGKMMRQVRAILEEIDRLPSLDHRSSEELIEYDEDGLPI